MITKLLSRKLVLLVIGLAAGSGILIPASYGSLHPVTSDEIQDGTIQAVDLASSSVTNSKIASNAVTGSKIATNTIGYTDIGDNAVRTQELADGTIRLADISQSAVKMEHRDDCNCGGTGWDPNSGSEIVQVYDNAATPNSAILANLVGFTGLICSAYTARPVDTGYFFFQCDGNIPNGVGLNYVIFNKQ